MRSKQFELLRTLDSRPQTLDRNGGNYESDSGMTYPLTPALLSSVSALVPHLEFGSATPNCRSDR